VGGMISLVLGSTARKNSQSTRMGIIARKSTEARDAFKIAIFEPMREGHSSRSSTGIEFIQSRLFERTGSHYNHHSSS
jgi:hypothetical protein